MFRKNSFLKQVTAKGVKKSTDFSGIEIRVFKNYAYTLHIPYQLYQFTPCTIKKYLNSRGSRPNFIKIVPLMNKYNQLPFSKNSDLEL